MNLQIDFQNYDSWLKFEMEIQIQNWDLQLISKIEIWNWNSTIKKGKSNILTWLMGMKIIQSYTDSEWVNSLTVNTRLNDISIPVPIHMRSLYIFFND